MAHPVAKSRIDARTRARLLGCFVAAVGLIDIGSALTPAVDHRFELISGYVTPSVRETAAGATALVGLALLLIGRGLVHRRKLAYRMALVLLAVSTVTHIVKGLDIEEAIIAADRRGHARALAAALHGSGRARAVAIDRAHGSRSSSVSCSRTASRACCSGATPSGSR